jgi:hypothetical protein
MINSDLNKYTNTEVEYNVQAYYDTGFSMSQYNFIQIMLINSMNRIVGQLIIPRQYLISGAIFYIPTMSGEISVDKVLEFHPTVIQYYQDTKLYIYSNSNDVSRISVIGIIG